MGKSPGVALKVILVESAILTSGATPEDIIMLP